MAETRVPYRDVADWLADATQLFAGRISDHIGADDAAPLAEARMIGLVETGDARRLAAQIAMGPMTRPSDPPERRALAQRLTSPTCLADLPVGRMLACLHLECGWAPPLALLCAVHSDARFAPLLGWLNDDAHRRHLTPALIARLCGDQTCLTNLCDHRLYHLDCITLADRGDQLPGDRAIALRDPVAAWLTGKISDLPFDPSLTGVMHPVRCAPLGDLLDDPPRAPMSGPFVVLGADGTGRRAVAGALMQQRGQGAQAIDAAALPADPRPILARALRDTALHNTGLIVAGAGVLAPSILHWLIATAPGGLALTAVDRLPVDLPQLRIPGLDAPRTRRIWTARLGAHRAEQAGQLAHQFRLPVDDILSIPAGPARSLNAIRRDCLDRSAGTLDRLATAVPLRHDWDDLVLPPRQLAGLQSIVSRARHARAVYDDWGFGRKLVPNRGLSALFSGPSGAGKTLSASVVARAIGLPLYRVDLSATVSKYIGETEKNLEQIFCAAESSNAVLLFDECDALFGKRSDVSDAHDRYANIETSYLLQRMEAHRGVVMMSSNHPQNIDEAFMRRIDVALEFSLPDAALRAALWDRLMPPEAGADVDVLRLGAQFELSGGSIRNCLVTAAFLATEAGDVITTAHCVRAVALEYEKIRRPLTRAEFGDAYPSLRTRKGA